MTTEEPTSRLKEILGKLNNPTDKMYVDIASTSASQELPNKGKEKWKRKKNKKRVELKEKLLTKLKNNQ